MSSEAVTFNESIRRKTKKIRDTTRRLTARFSESFNVNHSPSFSKFRQSFQYSPKSELQRIPKFSTKNSIKELPTKCIMHFLKYLTAKDLPNLRLVSKGFNEIIQNHALELPKIHKQNLNLCHPNGNKQEICPSKNSCESMEIENMDKALRHLKTQKLSLIGITVTSKLIRFLHRSIKYEIEELRFVECNFLIKSNELAIMIKQWEPKFLHFSNCKWNPEATTTASDDYQQKLFLDDLFFSVNKDFDFLCIDFSSYSPLQRLGFSNRFSQIFNDSTKLPSTIIFNNCLINITAKTLKIAIQRYINLCSQKQSSTFFPLQYLWSFGTINDSYGSLLATISNFEEYIVSQHENLNSIECVFQVSIDSPLLFLSFKFQSLISWENYSRKNDCEILWEEKDGFDFPEGFL